MRHDQAHKTNRARNRSRRTTQRHNRNNRRATHHRHRHTQAGCRILTECQGTQRTDQHERQHQTQRNKGQRRQHLLKGAVLQRTHHPETVRIKSLRIKHRDNAGNRAQAGIHRHTREHQTRRRIQVRLRIHQAHDEHQRRRQTRTGQRQPELNERGRHPKNAHTDHHGGGSTRVHTQQTRLSQRVTAQRLHEHTRHRQRGTHQQRRGGTRGTLRPNQLRLDSVRLRVEETINRAVQGEHARTHRKRQGAEQYQQNAANNERNRQTRDRLAALTARGRARYGI